MAKSITRIVRDIAVNADMVSKKRNGNILVRKGYFYGISADGSKFAESVMRQLTKAGIDAIQVDYGNHYANFDGNASVARSSHYWIELEVQ